MEVQECIPTAASEIRAKEFLAQRKFRKARDEYKLLSKSDKGKYMPFLIEANTGLMLEMLSKGLNSEAEQVRSYLKSISTPEQWKGIELSFACACSGGSAKATEDAFGILLASNLGDDLRRRRLADNIILARAAKSAPAPPGTERLVEDASAVQKGLEAIAIKDFAGALDIVRPIAHDSAFSHWKLFIKGLTAFHTGDFPKANRFFKAIPPNTVPERGCKPYIYLGALPDHKAGVPKAGNVDQRAALGLLGVGNAIDTLVEADRRWSRHRHAEAFKLLRSQLTDFPCEGNHWKGVLSDFCLHSLFHMHYEEGERLMECFADIHYTQRGVSDVERMLFARVECLYDGHQNEPRETQEEWQEYIELHEKLHGKDPAWASEAYLWIGRFFAQVSRQPLSPFGFMFRMDSRQNRMRDKDLAVASLEKSVGLNPGNLEAHLALCAAFKSLKRNSDLNRWRDVMTARFPDEKSVLIEAGCGCLDRRAYAKGIEYLERARHLDRLDASIPNHLVKARLFQAWQYANKQKLDKARQTLDGCEELLLDTPGNYLRSRWVIQIHRALIEAGGENCQSGRSDERGPRTQAAFDLALRHAPFPAAATFYAETNIMEMSRGHRIEFEPAWRKLLNDSFTPAQACTLLEILCFFKEYETGYPNIMAEQLEPYLKKLAPAVETRAERVRLIELVENFPPLDRIGDTLITKGHKKDPEDPLFQILDYARRIQKDSYDVAVEKLEKMLALAQRRQDEKAIRIIQAELQKVPPGYRNRDPKPSGPPDFDIGPGFCDDDDEDEDEFGGPESVGDDLADTYYDMIDTLPHSIALPEEASEETIMSIMIAIPFLSAVPDENLEEAAETAPAGLPKELLLKLVKAIRFWRRTGQFKEMVKPSAKLPKLPKPPKHKKAPLSDPNQMDLL